MANKASVGKSNNLPKMLFTAEEVCQMLAVSKRTLLYKIMRDPHNPLHSIGAHKGRRFTQREIDRWVAAEEAASGKSAAA